jgi:hypothetical protein
MKPAGKKTAVIALWPVPQNLAYNQYLWFTDPDNDAGIADGTPY